MTVVNPKSISGINSITMASGSDDLLTIHSNNTTERVRVNSSGDVIVGSGVTLSPDGDIFATGITTVSGNVKVGTGITLSPDGDVFATGVCTATSFIGNGSGLTNLATDLVNDTSPQLGGDLDTNSHNIILDDSHYLYLGDTSDASLFNDGSNVYLKNYDGGTDIQGSTYVQLRKFNNSDVGLKYVVDGAVELYHDGTKQCETSANGLAFPAGKGIDFSAQTHGTAASGVTVNSELLDHYEEGSFQPLLKRLMTNGTTETNFYDQGTKQGYYQIIGNRIYLTARIHWSGGSTGTGSLILTNLPYTPTSGGANEVPMYIGFRSGFNYTNVAGYLVQSMNRFMVQYYDANGSYAIAPSATDSSGHFYFAMNYQI